MAGSFLEQSFLIPGPGFHIDLPALDACHPVHYSRRLRFFRCASPAQRDAQLAAFKTGLRALVLRCPFLGGTVVELPPDKIKDGLEGWRTFVPGPGIELVARDLRTTMPSLRELEALHFPACRLPWDLLMPIPQDLGNDKPFAAFKVQYSAIEEGTILTFAMSHSVADGTGMDELMRVLIDETRLAQEFPEGSVESEKHMQTLKPDLGIDRSLLRNAKSDIPFNADDHPGYMWKAASSTDTPTPPSTLPHPFAATAPETSVLFHFTRSSLAQLKTDATSPGAPPISTHDAVCALMWRSAILIRSRRCPSAQAFPPSTKTNFFMPSDARRHLNFPNSYIGNVIYQLNAELELGTLASPSGLQHAAMAIRRAITAVNPSLVASYMAFTNDVPRSSKLTWAFLGSYDTTGFAMGTNLGSGDVTYKSDWGAAFGPVLSSRMVGQSVSSVMPRLPDGGIEAMVAVMPAEVEALKQSFAKYADAY